MKCYFALSDDVSNSDTYYYMFVAAINSARRNTTLQLHCLFDFRKTHCDRLEEDRIYTLLRENNVVIHLCSIDFERELLDVYTDDYLNSIHVTKSSLYSRFLRFIIADIETEDEYVLYADTDVLFLEDIRSPDISWGGVTDVAVCPEFYIDDAYTYFNAGVMLLNMSSYRNAKKTLISMLRNKERTDPECCDQGYLNAIYAGKFTKWELKYNWKPYWGVNPDAAIVHLHGLKPRVNFSDVECYQIDFVKDLLHSCKNARAGWFYYFNMFANYTGVHNLNYTVLTQLSLTLQCQDMECYSFSNRLKQKINRILKRIGVK